MDLGGFNPGQQEAVCHYLGPCEVIAGAGSGKTRVLTYRIAHLIEEYGVEPSRILACTFTKKAAGEMAERLEQLIGAAEEDVNVSTIHSLCFRILREEWRLQGKHFDVLADYDQKRLMKEVLAPPGPRNPDGLNLDYDLAAALRAVGLYKNDLHTVDDAYRMAGDDPGARLKARIYQIYEKKKRDVFAVDFDDMLLLAHRMLAENPAILAKWQSRFEHILVDEFQDTNRAQWEIIRMLAEPENNLFVVGDDWQSIYAFRGARPEYMIRFQDWYPDARRIFLDVNYRCPGKVIDLSNRLIKRNSNQVDKTLSAHNAPGVTPALAAADDEDHEAEQVWAEIQALMQEHGYGYGDFAILYRTNAQSRAFEDVFIRENVPHIVVGSAGFYARREIKDLVAYLDVIMDPDEATESVKRVINVPSRYLGKQFIRQVEEHAAREGTSFYAALTSCPGLKPFQRRGVTDFTDVIEYLRRQEDLEPADVILRVREYTGYDTWLMKDEGVTDGDEADNQRIDNLDELVAAARKFRSLPEFVRFAQEAAESKPPDEGAGDRIQLMSLHRSKGLEFPVVVMAGVNQGLLPHKNATQYVDGEIVPESVEEERRLCYVGMTRAKQRLLLSYMGSYRGKDAEPSMFLTEIFGQPEQPAVSLG